jgi:hypothetical protein
MAAGSTYTPLATTTLGSAAASVTLSSISGAYTDLVLVCNATSSSGSPNGLFLQVNSDTATNYSSTRLYGTGSAAASVRESTTDRIMTGWTSSTGMTTMITHLMNYSNTTTYKTTISRTSDSVSRVNATVGLWRSTSAITSIKLISEGTNFNSGSTFTLYGIAAA